MGIRRYVSVLKSVENNLSCEVLLMLFVYAGKGQIGMACSFFKEIIKIHLN